MSGHDPELCHAEPCGQCAEVYAERAKAEARKKICPGCDRPWHQHVTSEIDVCLLLARRRMARGGK